MITIGITGIIGSGKTTASNILKKKGLEVIDMDSLSKETIKDEQVQSEIKRLLGDECVTEKGVNTERLRDRVFKDSAALRTLETIIHPRVRGALWQKIEDLRKAGSVAVIIDGPLLFETGLYRRFDKIVVVTAEMDKIRERLGERGMTEEDVNQRIPHQIPLKEKEKLADYVVRNDGTIDDLEGEIDNLLGRIKEWEVMVHAS